MQKTVETCAHLNPQSHIRAEAERRMTKGVLVQGHLFRADDTSTQRVGEMLAAFEDGLVGPQGVRFRTAIGMSFAVTAANQIQLTYNAQRRYRAASDRLQTDPLMDPASDAHWPVPEAITLC